MKEFKADHELHDSRHITVSREKQEIKIYAYDVDSAYVDAFADALEEFLNDRLPAFDYLFKQKLIIRKTEQFNEDKESYLEDYGTFENYITQQTQ